LSAGQHVATGYKQKKVSWVSGGTGHHGPLSNAKVTGQGDGTVTCSVSMNANNWDIDAGSCAAQAHGKIIFSGVCPGTVEVELNTTFAEGATTISGILSSTPSITITHTVAADIAVAYGTNSFSRSKQYDGNIAGQLQKGHGTCAVAADANNGAYASEASVSTNISALTLTVDYDGDSTTCMEGCH
jgi:hypothetical protein